MNWEKKFKFDYAQIGGIRLHYATAGEGERLVILLHGFPEFWYSWRYQLLSLSDEYTVVAPDMRGYNLSDKPTGVENYRIEKLVDDVVGLIHHFGRREAAVIGHDWGAAVAWATAQTQPEALWKVGALQVPPMPVWRKNLTLQQSLASWYMLFFQLPFVPEWLLSLNSFALLEGKLKGASSSPNSLKEDIFKLEDIAEFKASWNRPNALTSALNYYRANMPGLIFSNPSGTETGEKIKVPSLFIYGEQDPFIMRETVRNIGEFIDAPFEEYFIPPSGHWVQQEAPETVTAIMREFLSKTD
jgi:pimeloyl-ACP methyl ester carboxylesterase